MSEPECPVCGGPRSGLAETCGDASCEPAKEQAGKNPHTPWDAASLLKQAEVVALLSRPEKVSTQLYDDLATMHLVCGFSTHVDEPGARCWNLKWTEFANRVQREVLAAIHSAPMLHEIAIVRRSHLGEGDL